MRAPPRLGLRAQIVLALSLVFALSFWLIGFATVQLTRRNADLDRQREQKLIVRLIAAVAGAELADGALDGLCTSLRGSVGLRGLRLRRGAGPAFSCGVVQGPPTARTALPDGAPLELWLSIAAEPPRASFTGLLIFYMAITGLCVLLLSYVALTHLIVRPLDRLTQSAAQLPHGGEHQFAREAGSAEVARLALTFNEMASLLRAERKQLVDRLAELERTTAALATKEQQLIHGEKLASIGRLAAGVAHEIGNPLAAILGLVELLRGGGLSEEESGEFLARIHRETERINGIIRDLLDFARRDVDEGMQQQSSDLREVIDDAVKLVRPQKVSKAVEISVRIDPATRRVVGPQHRLTQVVLNLLLNALDALEGRGAVQIEVRPSEDGSVAWLSVQDDGPGIPEQMRDKLFDPFTTTKPAGKGTGLGLAVSSAIIDALKGSIEASNRPEGGARFVVRLRQVPAPVQSGARVEP